MRDIKVLGMIMAASLVIAACAGPTTAPATTAPATQSPGSTPAAGELPEPEQTTLRIGISTPNEPVQFAQKLADSVGIYQKYGFTDVTVIGFEGDARALQALIAGQLDMFTGGASVALSSVVSDNPLKLVAMNSTKLTDGLWCTADIETPDDLRGKGVAISTFGGTSHGASLLLLEGIGLTDQDATIQQVGNQGTRIAALRGGSVACAVVDMSREQDMREAGMNLLYDLSTSDLEWGRSGFMATAKFVEENPNTVLVAVASALEAQQLMWNDPELAAEHFSEFAQVDMETALNVIREFQTYGSQSMKFSESAFTAPKAVLAGENPAVANADISEAYTLEFLERLEEIGFYEKIGAPTD